MIGIFSYTVILTYLSLISGCCGIFFAASGNPFAGICCLLLSGLFDMFDGKVARTKKNRTDHEKDFGIQIDSLTDLIAFGVLPAAIGYSLGLNTWWCIAILALYVLSCMIRLAYFNVLENDRTANESTPNTGFVGIPSTTSSLVFPTIFVLSEIMNKGFEYIYFSFIIILAFAFVAKIKVKKPHTLGAIIILTVGFASFIALIILKCVK